MYGRRSRMARGVERFHLKLHQAHGAEGGGGWFDI